MVTPTNGTCTFLNERTGAFEKANMYIADATGTQVKLNVLALAASTDPTFVQYGDPVMLVDVSIKSGPTVSTVLIPTSGNAKIPGKLISIADQLNSLTTRTPINLRFKAGSLIGFIEG